MIDRDFLIEKLDLITRDLKRLEIFSQYTIDEIAKDFMKYSALKNIFMAIVGRAIDINEHIISESSSLEIEAPKTYRETFLLLGQLEILPGNFAKNIANSAGLRNAIVHEYNNLDKIMMSNTIGYFINQYEEYCRYILESLEKGNI